MPESPLPGPSATDDLQFTTAETDNPYTTTARTGQSCVVCGQPIVSTYFAVGDKLLCPACREVVNAPVTGGRFGRIAKAIFFGAVAGFFGALIWFVIGRVTKREFGIVAILVGLMVGKAVRKGSGGQGGRGYQVLAVLLTYGFITANYIPDIVESIFKAQRDAQAKLAAPRQPGAKPGDAPAEVGGAADAKADAAPAAPPKPGLGEFLVAVAALLAIVVGIALAAPFLAGMQNVMGLLIIGIALWEAWKINAHQPVPISGPYQLGTPPAA